MNLLGMCFTITISTFFYPTRLATLAINDNIEMYNDNMMYHKCIINVSAISDTFEICLDTVTHISKIVSRCISNIYMMFSFHLILFSLQKKSTIYIYIFIVI